MGFLGEGNTLDWNAASAHIAYLKEHGIIQFTHLYNAMQQFRTDGSKWGDEIEYLLVHVDEHNRTTKLSLRGSDIIEDFIKEERLAKTPLFALWRPEYAKFMIEGTPGQPYNGVNGISEIESSMKRRRKLVQTMLKENEFIVSMSNFPRLGAPACTHPQFPPNGPVAQSQFLTDQVMNPHVRFATLTGNIRVRRGSKVNILIPLFRDKNTNPRIGQPGQRVIQPGELSSSGNHVAPMNSQPNHENQPNGTLHKSNGEITRADDDWTIYMDAMGFGMGCCCLQCTYQARDLEEACEVYDQFTALSPIMLALSAGSPVYQGLLSDIDCRWTVISQSVDDRTPAERGLQEQPGVIKIDKSRYASVSTYLSARHDSLNDIPCEINQEAYDRLIKNGVDKQVAKHVAHLFIRDPLVIYKDRIELDDKHFSDHFENIQSTNWQTARFKPPPPNSDMGYRVEFRPMDVQFTDFENAAFASFVELLREALVSLGVDLTIPLSLVDLNMATAHHRNAAVTERFYWRKHLNHADISETSQLSLNEIFNGHIGDDSQGLIPLVRRYVAKISETLTPVTLQTIDKYLSFISLRASGKLCTTASWMRSFILAHKAYNHDSVVSEEITHDLVSTIKQIGEGKLHPSELLGEFKIQF